MAFKVSSEDALPPNVAAALRSQGQLLDDDLPDATRDALPWRESRTYGADTLTTAPTPTEAKGGGGFFGWVGKVMMVAVLLTVALGIVGAVQAAFADPAPATFASSASSASYPNSVPVVRDTSSADVSRLQGEATSLRAERDRLAARVAALEADPGYVLSRGGVRLTSSEAIAWIAELQKASAQTPEQRAWSECIAALETPRFKTACAPVWPQLLKFAPLLLGL